MKGKVLVCIDDDASILQMLQYQLEIVLDGKNCISEFFENGEEAMDEIESMINNGWDVSAVIIDYQMPTVNGSQVVRRLKMKFPQLKCIMLSGQANEIQIEELLTEKLLDAFISKPWTAEELKQTVSKIIH